MSKYRAWVQDEVSSISNLKIAEMETKEGINKYHELMNLYKNNYSKAGVAPN